MKTAVKNFLKTTGWYEYIKFSLFFGWYERMFKPGEILKRKKEVQLYHSFLKDCDLIFDIGANDGHKTEAFLHCSKKVLSCEPDAYNFKLLNIRFRNRKDRVIIENLALADKEGEALLHIYSPGHAFNTLNAKWKQLLEAQGIERWNEKVEFSSDVIAIQTATLDSLILKYGKPEFIKIDTEGWEVNVLKGLSESINFLSFECFLPEFQTELDQCLEHILKIYHNPRFNIIIDERLINKVYIDYNTLLEQLKTISGSFEILVRD